MRKMTHDYRDHRFEKKAKGWAKVAPRKNGPVERDNRKSENAHYRFLNSLRLVIGKEPILDEFVAEDAARTLSQPALIMWEHEQSQPKRKAVV